jgi:hypothetical protein
LSLNSPIIHYGAADGVSAYFFSTTASSNLVNQSLAFLAGIPFSWWLSLGLVTVAAATTLLAAYNWHHASTLMEVDSPATQSIDQAATTTASSSSDALVEVLKIDGQEIRVCRPAGTQPPGQIQLPGRIEDGIFHIHHYNMYVCPPFFIH